MKIRNGFVSNSSSSSFIIAFNPKDQCPYCGRSSPNIVDLINQNTNCRCYSDDTQINWTDPQEYLEEIDKDIGYAKQDILSVKDRKDNDVIQTYGSKYTAGELRRERNSDIEGLTKQKTKIQNAINEGKQLVSIRISYHDEIVNNLFKEQVASGEVEVVVDEN